MIRKPNTDNGSAPKTIEREHQLEAKAEKKDIEQKKISCINYF